MAFIFHFIYGMSSFPLTHIFQRGRAQPPASWYFFCTSIPTGPSSWSCQNMSCRLCVFFRGKMARWKQQIKFTRPLFFCLHHHSYLHYVWSCDNDEPYLSTILILTVIQTHTPSRKDFPGVRAIISSLDKTVIYIYTRFPFLVVKHARSNPTEMPMYSKDFPIHIWYASAIPKFSG